MVNSVEELTEEERKALRGSKFAPLLPPRSSRPHHRVAHPGGPVATNKAVALAKFLERKLQEPGGLESMNPELVELAVKNAKETINASTTSTLGLTIRHVDSFDDPENWQDGSAADCSMTLPKKPKKKKKKSKQQKKKKKDKLKVMD